MGCGVEPVVPTMVATANELPVATIAVSNPEWRLSIEQRPS